MRFSLVAALVTSATAGLYEYADGSSAFDWLHPILTGMTITVASAASIRFGISGANARNIQDLLVKCAKSLGRGKCAKCLSRADPYYLPMADALVQLYEGL